MHSPHADSIIRVLTLNVWAHGGDWPARRRVLRDGLQALAPDLIALQETVVTDGGDQAGELLDDGYQLFHQQQRSDDGVGITIASRWPISRHREMDLRLTPRSRSFFAGTLLAEVAAPAPFGRLIFVNHLPSYEVDFEHERCLQAVAVARAIDDFADESSPVILAGDLDADPDAASIRFWTGRQPLDGMSVCYRDAWASAHADEPGETFGPVNPLADPNWPFRRIDYILVRCADKRRPTLAIERCQRAFDEPVDGRWATDHFGVLADLGLPDAG